MFWCLKQTCTLKGVLPPPSLGSIRMAVHRRTRGGTPPPTVGKNKIYTGENLVGPFLVHKCLGPPPPPLRDDC